MGTQLQSIRPALQQFYTVAGRLLFIDALDEWSASVVERFFRHWYLSPAEGSGARTPDAAIRIRRGGAPTPPPGGDSFEIANGGRCFTDGEAYQLLIDGSWVRFGGGGSRVVEVWAREGLAPSDPSLSQAVFNAFSGALRRCGLYELHSGGAVEPGREGAALFVGASGSGKSTLTLQLASEGWGYLSDDVVLLSEAGGAVEARPLRRAFAVTELSLAAAGLPAAAVEASGARPAPPGSKRRLSPHAFFPGRLVESCRPEALFFPVVTREPESRLRRLSRAEAMARLLRMCPWSCYDRPSSGGHLRVLSLLAGQCAAYELLSGTDLLEDPARTSAFLSARAAA